MTANPIITENTVPTDNTTLRTLTASVVQAFIGNNTVATADLPALIQSTYAALSGLGSAAAAHTGPLVPAVPVKKSVTPDYIICLEDGKRVKMLKRYLNVSYGLTPTEYRNKWGLPSDYPMVAPKYAQRRSDLAKSFGLGRVPSKGASGAGGVAA